MIICNYDRTWLGCSISMYMCNRVMMICLQVHIPSSKPASLCENHYQHKSFPGGKPWISTAMLFWYLSFQSKTVATGPQRSTTSRRVCRSARLWGGSAKCGSQRWLQMWRLGVFWWDRYPLVMTNIAIENGDLFSGFTHWTWWFSIVILVYQRVNLI